MEYRHLPRKSSAIILHLRGVNDVFRVGSPRTTVARSVASYPVSEVPSPTVASSFRHDGTGSATRKTVGAVSNLYKTKE
jgi:hypothetical protein